MQQSSIPASCACLPGPGYYHFDGHTSHLLSWCTLLAPLLLAVRRGDMSTEGILAGLAQGFTQHHTRRLVAEGLLPFRPAAYGVHNLWRRKKLLLARAHSLPGYREARTL